jgi:hypothetical protein
VTSRGHATLVAGSSVCLLSLSWRGSVPPEVEIFMGVRRGFLRPSALRPPARWFSSGAKTSGRGQMHTRHLIRPCWAILRGSMFTAPGGPGVVIPVRNRWVQPLWCQQKIKYAASQGHRPNQRQWSGNAPTPVAPCAGWARLRLPCSVPSLRLSGPGLSGARRRPLKIMRRIDYGIVSGRRPDGKDLMPGSR